MPRHTLSRSMHDLGLAAWFGGTLANAVGLNPAASEASDTRAVGRVTNRGWDRWTPVNGAAIGIHLLGSAGVLVANRNRLVAQQGVATMSVAKTLLTGAAVAVTGYSRVLGHRVSQHHDAPLESGTEAAADTPREVAAAQKQLRTLQWAVPALTGALVVMNAFAGEQQQPDEVRKGVVARLIT